MKILVTGAAGMLGGDLCPVFEQAGHRVFPTDIRDTRGDIKAAVDITDYDHLCAVVAKFKPDMIIHLAAETNVDKCELEPEHAYNINVSGTKNIAQAAMLNNAVMVYVSTAAVFGEQEGAPYTEESAPRPISIYAKTKFEGEKVVQGLLKKYFIVRAGWMIGGGRGIDKKFVAKIIDIMDKSNLLKAVNDKFGTITYTVDLSECLLKLIETDYYGVYHMSNSGICSRFDIAKEIVNILGRDDITVQPVSNDIFNLPAPRGKYEAIRNYMLELKNMNTMGPWQDALQSYIEKEFSDKIVKV